MIDQCLRTIQLLLHLNWCRLQMSLILWAILIKRHGKGFEKWWSQHVLLQTWCDILQTKRTLRNDSPQLILNLQVKIKWCVSISVFTYLISRTQQNLGMCAFDGSNFCLQSSLIKEIEKKSWEWVLVFLWIEKQLTWQRLKLDLSNKLFNLHLKFCKRCFQTLFINFEIWNLIKNIGLIMMRNMLSLRNKLTNQTQDPIKQSLMKQGALVNSIFKVKDLKD